MLLAPRPALFTAISVVFGCVLAARWPALWPPAMAIISGICMLVMWALKLPGRRWLIWLPVVVLAASYYHWTDACNVTKLHPPQGLSGNDADGVPVRFTGDIVSAVEVDGDHVSFVVRLSGLTYLPAGWKPIKAEPPHGEQVQVSLRLLKQEGQETAVRWERGEQIDVSGGMLRLPSQARNFGGFDYRRYLRLHGIHWLITVKGLDGVKLDTREEWNWLRLLRGNDRLRSTAGKVLANLYPPDQSGFMQSLLIGLQDAVDPQSYRQFSQLGLTHILAISGLHVGIFAGGCLFILRRLGRTKETSLLIVIFLVPLYVIFTGASPSVIRSGLMAVIALYAERKHWLKDGLNLACIAGSAMLLWNPYYVYDVSFQLSFLVTIGLILFVPKVTRLIPVKSKAIGGALAITVVSQLISFPLTIYYFNQFSLLSWFANLLIVPATSVIDIPFGSASLVVGAFSNTAGHWIAWPVVLFNKLMFWFVAYLSGWRGMQLIWPSPSILWILAYYALLSLICRELAGRKMNLLPATPTAMQGRAVRPWKLVILLLGLSGLLFYGYRPDCFDHEGSVHVLDVGQGDAILIRTPSGKHILIDGGGTLTFRKPGEEWKERRDPFEVGRKLLVPLLKQRGVQRIDFLILTHDDADHYGGLQAVVDQIPVGRMLFNGDVKSGAAVHKLFASVLERGVPMQIALEGKLLQIDRQTEIRVLYPLAESHRKLAVVDKQNDESVVFLLKMQGYRFLFTGDMENASENAVLREMADEAAYPEAVDVLKVAHHGSKTSTSEAWLDYWQPKKAAISVGANNLYGHPNPGVLDRLEEHHADIFRTDRNGEVEFRTAGKELRVETMLDD